MLGTILPALMSSAVLSPHHLILHIAQLCACHICSIASSTHPQEVRGSILCWSPIFNINLSWLKILLYGKKNLQPNYLFKLLQVPWGNQQKSWCSGISVKISVVQTQIRRITYQSIASLVQIT